MTKRYKLVSLNNEMYMIDKETKIKANEIGTDGYHIEYFRDRWQEKDWYKIVASTNKLLRLPLLPAFKKKIIKRDEFSERCGNGYGTNWVDHYAKPIAVEVEVEEWFRYEVGQFTQGKPVESGWKPRVNNNIIQIVKWIYEEQGEKT